jgi:hypothetical protein
LSNCHAATLSNFVESLPRNWQLLTTLDGVYKNSFFIFGRPEVNIEELNYRGTDLPWTISYSIASNKKIRFDDYSGMARTMEGKYHVETLRAVKAFNEVGTAPRG